MPEPSQHPSHDQLSAYNLGQLPSEEAVAIESHISECEPCCDTIVSLSSEDTFVGLLKAARQSPTDQTLDQEIRDVRQPESDVKQPESDDTIPRPLAEHPRYETVGLVGKGGMGRVYRARHRMMDRSVALKVINRQWIRKAEVIDRFHREVKTAASLDHPNIVTSHDAEQADDLHFLVMEFVDGVDLSDTVKQRGPLPITEACDYIRQAAKGLQYAHDRGMVHRDIKPHNLMVTQDNIVKILDFGLASLTPQATPDEPISEDADGNLTIAGAIMGTPDFISPEQAQDARNTDGRSDIYSLGMTLYYLLAGRVPFGEGSAAEKLKKHAEAEPASLNQFRDDIPGDLQKIIDRMTAKNPQERFRTPAEVVDALERFSKETDPIDSRQPQPQVHSRRDKLDWLPLTAIAAIFFAVIVAGIVYYIQTNKGVVRVEVTDDSLAVEISGQTVTMKDGDNEPFRIQAGENKLRVRQLDSGFEFVTDNFEILRDGEIAFKVDLIAGEVVVSKDGNPFDRGRFSRAERTAVAGGVDSPASEMRDLQSGVNAYKRRFDYDLSLVPADVMTVHGYRPHQIRQDDRFRKILTTLDQGGPNTFLMDGNLEQVLTLQWANEDHTYSQPIFVLTVIDSTAMEFARQKLGVEITETASDASRWDYHPVRSDDPAPMPKQQFVRFVNEKTLVLSSREFLDAHQVALKTRSNQQLLEIASSLPDAALWAIGNTSDKAFVEEIKFHFSESSLATTLMTQLPIWEDTSHLALSLTLDDFPSLQLSAHALSADRQKQITQTARAVPVTLANLLRASSDGRGAVDATTIGVLINALNGATISEPSNTETRISISLKEAEPHLFRTLNAYFDLAQAKRRAFNAASVNNLRQIGMAFMMFEQEHGYLPSVNTELPEAKHPVSWRVAILKYLDDSLYEQYKLDEPWDSDHNKTLLEKMPDFYRHPGQEKGMTSTCYVTPVGENTATGDGNATIKTFEDFTDPPQMTILVAEGFTSIPWTQPEDLRPDGETTFPSVHYDPDGWNVIFVDGSTHFIPSDTPADVQKALITRNGGEKIENLDSTWKKVDSASVDKPDDPQAVPPEQPFSE
ncbi:MAG: protein kinase, partial [Planctomycetota bacterium]